MDKSNNQGSNQKMADLDESGNGNTGSKKLKIYFWAAILVWTSILLIFAEINYLKTKHYAEESARIEARSLFQKDVIYRRWNSMHGGVYVPISEWSPPNKYLADNPDRDVTTTNGKKLTLINPAYMTRQVHELGKDQYGVFGHITSLKLIRPENVADHWETEALYAFEDEQTEFSSVEKIEEKEYMRLMRPLNVEEACLKCHADQGYKVGDIRGGISIAVPMEPRRVIMREEMISDGISIFFFLIVGMGAIIIFTKQVKRERFERERRERDRAERDKFDTVHKLAGAVAHEFRQPLTVLQTISALSKSQDKLEKDILSITLPQEVAKIDHLVTKLLSITSLEMKSYVNNQEIIDFN